MCDRRITMYIYGKNAVYEYIRKNKKVQKCQICGNFNDKNLISAIQKSQICIEYVSKKELDKLASGSHQGIILTVPDYKYTNLNDLPLEKILF